MFTKYHTSDLLKYFGITRDTLRFYEEKGLLSPQKNAQNNYRDYDIYDIYKLMIIDFHKKRGMSINQIQYLLKKSDVMDIQNIIETKKEELSKTIYEAQCMMRRLEETQEFSVELVNNLNNFTIKPLPRYKVKGEISDFIAIEEYENVKEIINSNNNDMLSQIIRYISFDKDNIKSTKMLIVETSEEREENEVFLEYPKCIYTVVEEIQPNVENRDIMASMHTLSAEYAAVKGFDLLGEAFAMVRLITYNKDSSKAYIEIFIPFI